MLTRPTRNIVLLLGLMVVPLLVELRPFALSIFLGATGLLAFMLAYGRQYFVARSLGRQGRWQEAIQRYEAFEARAAKLRVGRFEIPLFLSIYTYSGVALAKNNLATCHMNLRELERAKRLCREALELDEKYAVPYVNLGIIAAFEGDASTAAECLEEGFRLGYRDRGVQKQVRRILATVNVGIGDALSDGP